MWLETNKVIYNTVIKEKSYDILGHLTLCDEELINKIIDDDDNCNKFLKYFNDEIKDNKSIVMKLVAKNVNNLEFVSERLYDDKEVLLTGLKCFSESHKYIGSSLSIKDIILKLITEDFLCEIYEYLHPIFKSDEDIAIAAIGQDSYLLKYSPDEIKDNYNVVLAGVSDYSYGFEFASERLRSNKQLAIIAIQHCEYQYTRALEYLSEELRDDEDVVLNYIEHAKWYELDEISDRLKDDKNFALKAVFINGSVLEFLSDRLRDDRDVVIDAVKSCSESIQYASHRLRTNLNINLPL